MVFKGHISPKIRAYVKFHGEKLSPYGKENSAIIQRLAKKCKITTRTVYRLMKESLTHGHGKKDLKGVGGRKKKVSQRTEHRMIRNIAKLRSYNQNWNVRDLFKLTDIDNITERTGERILNRHGYNYLVARKKGIISEKDAKKRLRFARTWVKREASFWRDDIAFYFDGVGFQHKSNPKESASACQGKVWRKASEGLHIDCTAKGSKVGYGGKQAKFFVGISYDRGVIFAQQYDVLNGETFSKFIRAHFKDFFHRSAKEGKQWIQDGDPSQNSAKAKSALQDVGADLLAIPPRSPELNPIENVFAFVKKELKAQAIENNIEMETYEQFSLRVKATLYSSSESRINNIINSYGERLSKLIVRKGGKIEY